MIHYFIMMMKGQISLIDIWHYILGNYRYRLYYSKDKNGVIRADKSKHPLMRRHIWEQITYRIKWMDEICFNMGQCKICGCQTTHLQMANKSCDKPCYPAMMNKKMWNLYSNYVQTCFTSQDDPEHLLWVKNRTTGEPLLFQFKTEKEGYVQIK